MKLWNSDTINSKDYIHEVYRNGLVNSQEFENYTEQLFTLNMCLPACLWANCDAVNFRDRFFSFQHWEKLSYRKDVHHNPIIKYASRCLEKRRGLYVSWDKSFPEARTNRVESIKIWRWKVPWPKNEIHSSRSRANTILSVRCFAPHTWGQ